jgi:hypothetical protein
MPREVRVGSSGACPVLRLGPYPAPGTCQENQLGRAVNSGHVTTLCRSGGGARLGRDPPGAAPPGRSPRGPSRRAWRGCGRLMREIEDAGYRSGRYVVTGTCPWRCPTLSRPGDQGGDLNLGRRGRLPAGGRTRPAQAAGAGPDAVGAEPALGSPDVPPGLPARTGWRRLLGMIFITKLLQRP